MLSRLLRLASCQVSMTPSGQVVTAETMALGVDGHVAELQLLLRPMADLKVRVICLRLAPLACAALDASPRSPTPCA